MGVVGDEDDARRPGLGADWMKRSTVAASLTPSAEVGSSRMSTRAPKYMARPIASTCRSPPDSEPTSWSPSRTRVMPKRRICSSAMRLRRLGVEPLERRASPSSAPRQGRNCGRRSSAGWCRHPDARSRCRAPGASRGSAKRVSSPSRRMVPLLGWWNPDRILISVDLPAPLSPSRQTTLPAGTDDRNVGQRLSRRRSACRRCAAR